MAKELSDAVAQFVYYFQLVFDHDWDFSQDILRDPELFIKGTFINPNVEDEGNNWGNRGGLLDSYRSLKALLDSRGIDTSPESNL
jgi:hypothetical protein